MLLNDHCRIFHEAGLVHLKKNMRVQSSPVCGATLDQQLLLMSDQSNAAIDLTLDNLLRFKKSFGPFSGIPGARGHQACGPGPAATKQLNYGTVLLLQILTMKSAPYKNTKKNSAINAKKVQYLCVT